AHPKVRSTMRMAAPPDCNDGTAEPAEAAVRPETPPAPSLPSQITSARLFLRAQRQAYRFASRAYGRVDGSACGNLVPIEYARVRKKLSLDDYARGIRCVADPRANTGLQGVDRALQPKAREWHPFPPCQL